MFQKKQIHPRKNKMVENSIVARCHNKFWFLFLLLFVCWNVLLYGLNWSSFPSVLKHQSISTEQFHVDPINNTTSAPNNGSNTTDFKNHGDFEELERELEPLLKQSDEKQRITEGKSCAGRYVYVHELPSRFNEDLIKECKLLSKWIDMCDYLVNMGLGHEIVDARRVLPGKGWFFTNQFSLEPIFHSRMKQYECLTNNSSEAAAIFVPYYAGFDVGRYLWDGFNNSVRDTGTLDVVKWLRERPEWEVMGGRDHFLVAGRITWDFRRVNDDSSWGNKLMWLPESKNMTILTIESSPWNKNDFAIPYPSYFHPASDDQVLQWQNRMRRQRRRTLFSFAGALRPNIGDSIRGQIMGQCLESKGKCRILECKPEHKKCDNPVYVMKVFQNSVFCLQPPGDSFTRKSTFDSILAGCIPVFFTPASAYTQYTWHLPKSFTKYSVLIPEDDVKENNVNIASVLSRISRSEVSAMREEVIMLIPRVVYADPRTRLETIKDAFDLTVEAVIDRVKKLRKEMREGNDSSIDFDEENSWKYYTFGTVANHEWDHFFRRNSNWQK